jgi:hypothetical protein
LYRSQNFGGSPHPNHWSQALYTAMKDPALVEFEDDVICIIKGFSSTLEISIIYLSAETF